MLSLFFSSLLRLSFASSDPVLAWMSVTVWYWGGFVGVLGSKSHRAAFFVVSKREERDRAKGIAAVGFWSNRSPESRVWTAHLMVACSYLQGCFR